MVGSNHAAEPVIVVLRVRTLTGITRYVRADDLAAAREGQQPYVPTCDQYGVREADLHPRRPAFLHRLRTENIVQADALPPIRVEAEPVPVAAAPIAATTAAGLVLDAEEETEGYSL